MFRKPFRVQSNEPCKGAERKQLKRKIALQFPKLPRSELDILMPDSLPLSVVKLVTFGGVVVTTYHLEGDPLFFNHGATVCPSIYSIWMYPSMLKPVMIANQTLSKLLYGEDLLLSAVVPEEEGGYTLEGFQKGDYCCVRVQGATMFTGVGMCLADYAKMVEYDMKIEGFRMLHFQGDLLWEMGSNNSLMDTHMRSCIKAAAKAVNSDVIPLPKSSSPTEPEGDKELASHHIMIKPSPEDEKLVEVDPVDQFEEFKQAAVAALTPNSSLPVEDKRAAITRALEERTRYIRTLPNPKIGNMGKKPSKLCPTPFEGLSGNPEVSPYRAAIRILDDADDEFDEVGVTLPAAYQSDVSDSVYKASQYYDRLGLQVADLSGRALTYGDVKCSEDSDSSMSTTESPSGGDLDEIGISVPRKYGFKKKFQTKQAPVNKPPSPPPVDQVHELRKQLWRLTELRKREQEEILVEKDELCKMAVEMGIRDKGVGMGGNMPEETGHKEVDVGVVSKMVEEMGHREDGVGMVAKMAELMGLKEDGVGMVSKLAEIGHREDDVGKVSKLVEETANGEEGVGMVKEKVADEEGVAKPGVELEGEAVDEIGISMPEAYCMRHDSGGPGARAEVESSSGEEEEEERQLEGACSTATKTWYSIPEQKGKMTAPIPVEDAVDMDELLKECFFAAVKSLSKEKPVNLCPLLTSTFYRTHMLELCPSHLRLDVKKSSYRKLSKFLQQMQQEGILKLGENSKGSEVISSFEFKHPMVKRYTPCLLPEVGSTLAKTEGATAQAKPSLKISTLYMPSHRLVTFFRELGFSKASILDYQQVRESVLKYVKENQLVDSSNPKHILPDPTLGDALHHRGAEANKAILRQELINMVIEEMKPAYSITRGTAAPIIKRGKLEPIRLSLVQKMGNKKVTLVDNLEFYGVPASDLAQSLQKMAAASTTVNDVPGKPTARQVQVQGNAVKVIAKLLQDTYGVPVNYIEAIDKIKPPKNQKKRKRK